MVSDEFLSKRHLFVTISPPGNPDRQQQTAGCPPPGLDWIDGIQAAAAGLGAGGHEVFGCKCIIICTDPHTALGPALGSGIPTMLPHQTQGYIHNADHKRK